MSYEDLNLAAESHFYWFTKAIEALDEMRGIAFDMSEQGSEKFAAAQKRFNDARARCKTEFDIFFNELKAEIVKPDPVNTEPIDRLLRGGGEGGSTDCLFEDENDEE